MVLDTLTRLQLKWQVEHFFTWSDDRSWIYLQPDGRIELHKYLDVKESEVRPTELDAIGGHPRLTMLAKGVNDL